MTLPVATLSVLKELITAATQYQMCKEHERTERMKIEAQLEAALTIINRDHENFMRAMDDNQATITRAYDAVEGLLANPAIATNPTLLQMILTFLQHAHSTHGNNFANVVNAHSARLPRIG